MAANDPQLQTQSTAVASQAEAALFGVLPTNLFRPLSGANRHVFSDLLERLHPIFFPSRAGGFQVITSEHVREEISAYFRQRGIERLDEYDDDEDLAAIKAGNQSLEYRMYVRLLQCGWYREVGDPGSKELSVTLGVSSVWGALVQARTNQRQRPSAKIRSIASGLRDIVVGEDVHHEILEEAASNTDALYKYLNQVFHGIAVFSDDMGKDADASTLVDRFYNRFVPDFIYGDTNHLRNQDHPHRYRNVIIHSIDTILANLNDGPGRRLVETRAAANKCRHSEAEQSVIDDLSAIRQTFLSVDDALSRITGKHRRVTRRVLDIVRLLDTIRPGQAARWAKMVQFGLRSSREDASTLDSLSQANRLLNVKLYSVKVAFPARSRHVPVEPEPIEISVQDPRQAAYEAAETEFLAKLSLDPDYVLDYLIRHVGEAETVHARDLPIDCVQDLVTFIHLPQIQWLDESADIINAHFRVDPDPDRSARVENAYFSLPAFRVTKRGPLPDSNGSMETPHA